MMEWFSTDNKKASLFVRVGLALTLLLSALTKFTATEQVTGMFDTLLGFGSAGFTIFMGVVVTVLALLLLFDVWPQPTGTALSVFFAVSIISGFIASVQAGNAPFGVGPAIWKDFGLLGASLAVAFQE